MLPTGIHIDFRVHASDIRTFMLSPATAREIITCFRCGEQGHYKSECFGWKTRMCVRAHCDEPSCGFAHSAQELRTPWRQRCIRIVRREGCLVAVGCMTYGHTFKNCPTREWYDGAPFVPLQRTFDQRPVFRDVPCARKQQ